MKMRSIAGPKLKMKKYSELSYSTYIAVYSSKLSKRLLAASRHYAYYVVNIHRNYQTRKNKKHRNVTSFLFRTCKEWGEGIIK